MKHLTTAAAVAVMLILPAQTGAQSANPTMDAVKAQHGMVKGVLLKTAEKVPEAVWAFRPTPEVRTFAQIVGHIADANMMICGAGGERQAGAAQCRKDDDDQGAAVEGAGRLVRLLRQGHRRRWTTRRRWKR